MAIAGQRQQAVSDPDVVDELHQRMERFSKRRDALDKARVQTRACPNGEQYWQESRWLVLSHVLVEPQAEGTYECAYHRLESSGVKGRHRQYEDDEILRVQTADSQR